MATGRVAALAVLPVRAGAAEAAAAAFQPFLDNARDEAGTHVYMLHVRDATSLVVYELYANEAAATAHTTRVRQV
jgi:quinol monooxygenase YgiN